MSEAFPSAGGADCAYECGAGESSFTAIYHLGGLGTPAADALESSFETADAALLALGEATVTPASSGTQIHISLNYFCCYSVADKATIKEVLATTAWPALNVSFDKPTWRVDSGWDDGVDHYSIVVLLDEASQGLLASLVEDVEDRVRDAGVDVHVPRAFQEPFHSTLGVVSGRDYPAVAAIAAVNKAVPPGAWNIAGPIAVQWPDF
jgi:hypothetical protein